VKKQNSKVHEPQKPKPRNWKKLYLIYIAIATAVVYCAISLFFSGGQKSSSISNYTSLSPTVTESNLSPTPIYGGDAPCKKTPDSTDSGEIYICKEFSITLPAGWMEQAGEFTNYDVGKAEGRDFDEKRDAGKLKFGVQVDKTNQDLDKYVKEYMKGNKILSYEPTSLSGYGTIKVSAANTYYPNQLANLYFIKNPKGSSVATIYTIFGFYKNNVSIFDQAASTLKFAQ